jgi:hypothetical protein
MRRGDRKLVGVQKRFELRELLDGSPSAAYKRALQEPFDLKDVPDIGADFKIFAAFVLHLSESHPTTFILPQRRLAELFRSNQIEISRAIGLLIKFQIIERVEEANFLEHRAALYQLGVNGKKIKCVPAI